jgi:hypothetical protein
MYFDFSIYALANFLNTVFVAKKELKGEDMVFRNIIGHR